MCAERIDSPASLSARPSAYSSPAAVARPDLDDRCALAGVRHQLDVRRGGVRSGLGPRLPSAHRAAASTLSPASSRSSCFTRKAGSGTSAAFCLSTRQVFTAIPSTVCSTAERTGHRVRRQQAGGVAEQPEPVGRGDHQLDAARAATRPGPAADRPACTERASPRSTSSPLTSIRCPRRPAAPRRWSARALISWARHGDQAAGPAARASASVRQRSRSSTSARPVHRRDQRVDAWPGRRGRAGWPARPA